MNNNDVKLSKSLSWLLRHGATTEGLSISIEGYVEVDRILQHKSFRGIHKQDIERIVNTNSKQRFKLRHNPQTQLLEIKANQGHSISAVSDGHLTPILEFKFTYSTAVHGTYLKHWPKIKKEGLSRMTRQHIHLAKGTLQDKTVISGLRHNIEVYIYINVKKALLEGLKFFESENGVILTAGNENGYLLPKYFLKVTTVTGEVLST